MYLCMHCIRVYVCAFKYAHMHLCIYVCMHAYMHTCMYVSNVQVDFEQYGGIGQSEWFCPGGNVRSLKDQFTMTNNKL